MRGKHATPWPYRSAGKQFMRSAAYDRGMHKVFGNEPLQAVKRDPGRNATLVPGEDASPRGEPVNTECQPRLSENDPACVFYTGWTQMRHQIRALAQHLLFAGRQQNARLYLLHRAGFRVRDETAAVYNAYRLYSDLMADGGKRAASSDARDRVSQQ